MSEQIANKEPRQVGAEFLRQQRPHIDAEHAATTADRVFKAMHGFYGVLFLSKFTTGHESAGGGDDGVLSAKKMWGMALSRYTTDVVRMALGRCMTAHPEFPPSLPQFVALCEACRPRETYRPPANAIGMSQELRSSYARRLREVNAKYAQRARDRISGGYGRDEDEQEGAIPVLQRLVAESIGLAGGDEAAALRRMEVRNAPAR